MADTAVGANNKSVAFQGRATRERSNVADLNAKARSALPKKDFGLPGKRAFPMPDPEHARLAIGGATRSENAGNISAGTADKIKSEARAKLGKGKVGKLKKSGAISDRMGDKFGL